jgi:hypothetical protein
VGLGKPAEIEVRQLYEMDDFQDIAPASEIEKFRELGMK